MFNSLQLGRGLAATAVCAFHLSLAFQDPRYGNHALFGEITKYGRFGVDFFFALSGFIILFAHWRDIEKPSQFPRFVQKRFVRIYPIYWVMTLVVVVASSKSFVHVDGWDWISISTLIRFTDVSTPLIPAWTLFHEIFFYSIFALLIFNRALGIAGFAIWLGAIVVLNQMHGEGGHSFVGTALAPINLCFFAGMAAYFCYGRISWSSGGMLVLVGACAIVLSIFVIDESSSPLVFSSAMACAFFMVMTGTLALDQAGKIGVHSGAVLLGNASYALYLSHQLSQTAVLKAAYNAGLVSVVGLPGLFIFTLMAVVAIGIFIHLFIEQPLIRFIASVLAKRMPVA